MKDFRKGLPVRQGTGTPGAGFSKGEVNQVVSKSNEARAQYEAAKKKTAEREATKGSGMRQQGMYTGKADIRDKQINKKEKAKEFLKEKAGQAGQKEKGAKYPGPGQKDGGSKKEKVLADARQKMGINEEKRAEFQQRAKEARAKRMAEAKQKK